MNYQRLNPQNWGLLEIYARKHSVYSGFNRNSEQSSKGYWFTFSRLASFRVFLLFFPFLVLNLSGRRAGFSSGDTLRNSFGLTTLNSLSSGRIWLDFRR